MGLLPRKIGLRKWRGALPALALLAAVGCSASAAPDARDTAKIAKARGGETIMLSSGSTGMLTIRNRNFRPAITIDASAANLTGIVLDKVDGVTVRGGTLIGTGGKSYGVSIRSSSNIRITDMTVTNAHRGVVVNESQDIVLVGLKLTGLISDGINIALSRRVLVEGNQCRSFRPNIATYDSDGKRIRDGDHPDCIQVWSRPSAPPSADIKVINNDIAGMMQGIFFGNHVRGGIDDGGFDRITMQGNRIQVSYTHGIALGGVRGAIIKNNHISTVPGAMMPNRPNRPVKAVMTLKGVDIDACGNTIDLPGRPRFFPGTEPCR